MQKRPNAPYEITGLRQREAILSGEESAIRQILDGRGLEPGHAGPPKQMEVPQPTFALLHIGLQKIHRLSKFHIFTVALRDFLLNKLPHLTPDHFLRISAVELLEQIGTSGQKSGGHHGRANREVLPCQIDAIANRSHAVADLESQIPQMVEYLLE